jgi:ubiquinol-cytochrome c reductase cytochrome b subunit
MLGLMVVHFPRFLVFDVPMVMAISGAIMLTGGVFPVGLGLPFEPEVPPGITVPEWYLTGLYAFLRTMYDKFITGVAWPGLFIFALLIVPFIDKYKKFSWKDRPIITAVGITSLAQIIVTTYWGFYIDPDRNKALLERLVIDPIFFYLVMILLIPLSFGFTYMMIKLAKHAEANAQEAHQRFNKYLAKVAVCPVYSTPRFPGIPQHLRILCGTSRNEELLSLHNRHNDAGLCSNVPCLQVR